MNATARGARHLLAFSSRIHPRTTQPIATFFAPKCPFHTLKQSSRLPKSKTLPIPCQQRSFTTRPPLRNSPNPNPNPITNTTPVPPASKSLSQRLKDLGKEYGWTALAVYLALSALDFPFCFLAVRWIGTEKIAAAEHAVVNWVKGVLPFEIPAVPEGVKFWKGKAEEKEEEVVQEAVVEGAGASLGTQLALAYAIHKSFIFLRVPLTAAVLPKIVKTLRGWGWQVGKRREKIAEAVEKGVKS